MMTAPEKTAGILNYGFVQLPVPPPGAPQPNAIPINVQWNANPMGIGPNVYLGSQMWNVPPPSSQIILPSGAQWTIQPAPPAYATTAAVLPDTKLTVLHQTFLKGKPFALGIVLIVTAILEIAAVILLPFIVQEDRVFS